MSSYLTFRKDNVVLCSFSRNTELYQACSHFAKFDEWTKVSKTDFSLARENLKDTLRGYQKNKDTYQETLKYNLAYEDLLSTIQTLQEIDEEILEVEAAISELNLLENIANEMYCSDNIEEEQDCVFEWKID